MSFAAALAILDIAPLYTLETERIWLFMVPFLAIGAAALLTSKSPAADSSSCELSSRAWTAMLLMAGQTVVMEVLFDWFW